MEPAEAIELLDEARARTLALVEPLSDELLERAHSPLLGPLAWDLGHIAAFEDLWLVHRHGGRRLLREDLADVYDAFESPRAGRSELPFLRPPAARDYLERVHERAVGVIEQRGVGDGTLAELVIRHEHQHNETMLQAILLAQLPHPGLGAGPSAPARSIAPTGLEMIEVPAGDCTLGAAPDGFAYDNERPRHRLELPEYRIGRGPVTNGAFLDFVRGGGYERREWWSPDGWSWRQSEGIDRPGGWSADLDAEWRLGGLEPLLAERPVIHLSWFEADAFARAHGARLPTEPEWEKAATWDASLGAARRRPWLDGDGSPGAPANLDGLSGGPDPVGWRPEGSSPCGCLGMIGDVWEWTSTAFDGYPGFAAHPYREYSQVFFGSDHRVLRGGSWATRPRVATTTFRNWDFPQRRQIFSGFRLAADA